MPKATDDLEAVRIVAEALQGFDAANQERIIRWARERLGLPVAEPGADSTTLEAAERDHILRTLRESRGQIGGPHGAAARLGLKRTTLNSKMKKLGITRRDF